jgi:hypothetical protein
MRTLAETFSIYFHGLRAAVTTTLSAPRQQIAFADMVWRYILNLSGRLDSLIRRWQNGTLPKSRAPRPPETAAPRAEAAEPAETAEPTPRKPRRFPLPTGHMWLIRRIPATVAFGSQLRHLLANDADLRAFLKAAPQARRLLNPLCRAFGIEFDKPYGVPLIQAPAPAEPAARPAPPPPAPPQSPAAPAPPPLPLVFSSA